MRLQLRVTGKSRQRDAALLAVAYGTGLTANEIAKLRVSDYLGEDGKALTDSAVRAEIAFNGKSRPLIWSSRTVRERLDDYLSYRVQSWHGVTVHRAVYRGLDPESPLFLAVDGKPFTFTRRLTTSGAVSYSCESLAEIYRRLHLQAGIEHGNASSARRTFAVRLHRKGHSLKLIQQFLGVSSLAAIKRLVEGDAVRLSSVVAGII